ncbi:MAG: SURF1 family protein [Sphingomonadaceae bacterium]
MTRLPIISTIIVGGAVAVMIGLGVWQLGRAEEKRALIAQYAGAAAKPEMAYPAIGTDSRLWFRRASALCLEPASIKVEPGRNRKGQSGWRHIAQCRTGAEGPGLVVDIGWSAGFSVKAPWTGGPVKGVIAPQPDHRSVIAKGLGSAAPGLMLVSNTPATGLEPSAPPSLDDVPNNHLAYAVQWFLFAGIAALIYMLALRRRA